MKAKKVCRKILTAVLIVTLAATQMISSGFSTSADSIEETAWETVFSRSENLELRSNGNSTLFTGLDKNSKYMLDFDMTVVDTSSLLLVGLRSDATYKAGQYLQLGNQQPRISSDYWSGTAEGGTLYSAGSMSAYAAGDVVAVKVLMAPTSVTLYLDGAIVQMYDMINGGYKDATAVPSIANGSLLFGHNGGGTGIDVSNITLKKECSWSDNILTNQANIHISNYDYTRKMLDVTLNKNTAYQLEFDMTVNALATTNLAVILRESEDTATGIYSDYWFSMNQIRTGSAIDGGGWPNNTNDTIVNGSIIFDESTTYSVKYVIEPDKVYLYINDSLVPVILGTSGGYGYSSYTTVSKIDNAKIGFLAQSTNPDITISNIVLRRDLSKSANISSDEELSISDSEPSVIATSLTSDFTYLLDFNMVVDTDSPTYVILRGSSSNIQQGQNLAFWSAFNQMRVSTDMWGLDYLSMASPSPAMTDGAEISVKVIMEPTSVTVYLDNVLLIDHVEIDAVENGSVAFVAGGENPNANISDIFLRRDETGDVPTPEENWKNVLNDKETIHLNNGSKQYLNATLEASTSYQLSFDMTVNNLATSNLAVILRENSENGIYSTFKFQLDKIITGLDIEGQNIGNGTTLVENRKVFQQNTKYSVMFVIKPELTKMYIDNTIVMISHYSKIANAAIGFVGQNSDPDIDITNISFKANFAEEKTGDINKDNTVGINDTAIVRKVLLGVSESGIEDCDIHSDETVDVLDLVALENIISR